MMRLKSFETQKVRGIGQKETGESKCFLISWMGIIKYIFQVEAKKFEDQERLKM